MAVASLWTAEVDETAFSSWTAGISARETAKAIYRRHGVMVSRNAVIGRAGRKGWKTPAKPTDGIGAVKPRRNRTKTRPNGVDGSLTAKLTAADAAQKLFRLPAVPPEKPYYGTRHAKSTEGFELLDMPENGCRYPTGENEHRHLFCGHPQAVCSPYCESHHGLAYRKCNARVLEDTCG